MQIEKIVTDAVGPDGSLIHAGRSRQDMYATFRAAQLRNQVLDFSDALNSLRDRVLVTAAKHVNTIVPAYTNGVQAQPVSYAHYLLAFEASFARDAQRIHELHARLNRSAMGTAVLANSGWPLNRRRLADLLGFDGLIENSYDAGQVFPTTCPSRRRASPARTRSAWARCWATSTPSTTRRARGCSSRRGPPTRAAPCRRSAIPAS